MAKIKDQAMTAQTNHTQIMMVLDRSGSMSDCRIETIDAVNKYLLELRQDANLKDGEFELLTFDTESIDSVRAGKPTDVADLALADYLPRAGTPLYDAIGRGIDKVDTKLKATGGEKAILVIVTDGMENSSTKHSHSSISELIKARQANGWLVVFLAAGLEAALQGAKLGIRSGTVANIGTDAASLNAVATSAYALSAGYGSLSGSAARSYASTASFSAKDRQCMGDASKGAGLTAGERWNSKAKPKKTEAQDVYEKTPSDAWGS